MNDTLKREAIEIFGAEKVFEVISAVEMIGEADVVHTTYEDQGDEDAVEIIEMLYFEID